MLSFFAFVNGHVPTYGGGVENCFTPPHHHDTSQVIYIRGSGGLEIHCSPGDCPFGYDETLDVDAVFRDQVDQSTYDLYIGCGGCVATADPIVIPPVQLSGYEPAVIEPFTQTRYSSVFPKAERKYDASCIHPDVCTEGHFTIRLVDYMNRTDGEPVVWGAVIGLGESFTFSELMLFPVFVLRNHGDTWNEHPWTWWVTLFLFAPLLLELVREAFAACGVAVLRSGLLEIDWELRCQLPVVRCSNAPARAVFYELACIAFIAVMLEEFIHLNIAAQGTDGGDHGYWVGLGAVILFSNGLPLWQVLTAWAAMEYRKEKPEKGHWARFRYNYWTCCASPWWAPFEIIFGFSYFLLFGAGFYIGPTLICIAGLLRLRELRALYRRARTTPIEVPPAETQTLMPRLFMRVP